MKRMILLFLIPSLLLLTACQSGNVQTNPSTQNTTQSTNPSTPPTSTPPTSSQQFPTTGPAKDNLEVWDILFGDMNSWYNRALLCQYSDPAQLNLQLFFYGGFAEESPEPTDAEWEELKDLSGFDINYDLIRLPVDKMNQVLTEYFGITLEDIDEAGFDNLVFLESTNCYYHMVTGAKATENFRAISAETLEDGSIRLTYTAGYNDTEFVVTLISKDAGYQILSNTQA